MAVFFSRRAVDEGWTPPDGPHFIDVPEDHWAYPYVEYCLQQGIVQGYWDGSYHPERVVTRDQMAVFMERAYHVEPLP
jgi:hypothetical protein